MSQVYSLNWSRLLQLWCYRPMAIEMNEMPLFSAEQNFAFHFEMLAFGVRNRWQTMQTIVHRAFSYSLNKSLFLSQCKLLNITTRGDMTSFTISRINKEHSIALWAAISAINQSINQSFYSSSDTFSVIHIHNKFTVKKQRRDENDMLEAI